MRVKAWRIFRHLVCNTSFCILEKSLDAADKEPSGFTTISPGKLGSMVPDGWPQSRQNIYLWPVDGQCARAEALINTPEDQSW